MRNLNKIELLILHILLLTAGLVGKPLGVNVGIPVELYQRDKSQTIYDDFFVKLLNHIADESNWEMNIVILTKDTNSIKSSINNLDLILEPNHGDITGQKAKYSQQSIISTWAQVYTNDRTKLETIMDLEKKPVGVLQNSPYDIKISNILKSYNIDCDILVFKDIKAMQKALKKGWIDAIVIDRLMNLEPLQRESIRATSVVFSPIEYHFKTYKNEEVLKTIDTHLAMGKKDPNSNYHQLVNAILGIQKRTSQIPKIIFWVIIGMAGLTVILISANFLLKKQVNRKTAELESNNQRLRREIRKRIQTESDLREAKIQAEAANKAKSEFLANMSHEIRTPLNGVIGFTELVLETELNKTQKEYLQTAYNSANSLLDLINDILDFSKIEAGKLELSHDKTDIIELCDNIMDMVKTKAHEKGLELMLNLPPDINRFIWTDQVRLRQILVNLLSNAIKFTDSGEVELRIEVPEKSSQSGLMEFKFLVRDTGIGISDVQKKKIFDSFTQADSSTTRKYGGSGLGLTITSQLIEKMGGQLKLESESGRGSCFYFSVSLKSKNGQPIDINNINNINKILIVDDNTNNRRILKNMLKMNDIESEEAENGLVALDKLKKKNGYDLVIMDYHMPDMDGLEVINNIRNKSNIARKDLPIFFLHSSTDDIIIRERCKKMGVNVFMTKPVKMKRLFNAISKISDEKEDKVKSRTKSDYYQTVNIDYNILIAEDNRTNMMFVKAVIGKILPQARLIEAENGAEAIELFEKNNVDLILMDIQMPQVNGYEAASRIRALDNNDTPIIALTAKTVKGVKERCHKAGMNDYITKPVKIKTIQNIFEESLNRKIKISNNSRSL